MPLNTIKYFGKQNLRSAELVLFDDGVVDGVVLSSEITFFSRVKRCYKPWPYK